MLNKLFALYMHSRRSMIVLGIHFGHDSSCAVVKDGQVIADASTATQTVVGMTLDCSASILNMHTSAAFCSAYSH